MTLITANGGWWIPAASWVFYELHCAWHRIWEGNWISLFSLVVTKVWFNLRPIKAGQCIESDTWIFLAFTICKWFKPAEETLQIHTVTFQVIAQSRQYSKGTAIYNLVKLSTTIVAKKAADLSAFMWSCVVKRLCYLPTYSTWYDGVDFNTIIKHHKEMVNLSEINFMQFYLLFFICKGSDVIFMPLNHFVVDSLADRKAWGDIKRARKLESVGVLSARRPVFVFRVQSRTYVNLF